MLWIYIAVMNSAHYATIFDDIGVLRKILAEEIPGTTKGAIADMLANWLVPLTMAFLSVTSGT